MPALSPPLAVSTAPPERSIWRDVPQRSFRENVANLQACSNERPSDPKVYSWSDWNVRAQPAIAVRDYTLPFEVEQRLVDDLAFIVATEYEPISVSAASFEEVPASGGLVVRIATNKGISMQTVDSLKRVFDRVETCARKSILSASFHYMFSLFGKLTLPDLSRSLCKDQIFDLVITLDRKCLHGRIRSKHWKPVKKLDRPPIPIEIDLQKFRQRSSQVSGFTMLARLIDGLCTALKDVNNCMENSEQEYQSLKAVVRQSHMLCHPEGLTLQETLIRYGFDPREEVTYKITKQLDKIGRYFGLCEDLVQAARKYRNLFQKIDLFTVPPYREYISESPTLLGREVYYVHAEIQMLSFYELHPELRTQKPRIIGVSKGACYLCNLFILEHGQFYITKTHGKLYHKWTFPDLESYSDTQRHDYARILDEINTELQQAIIRERGRQGKRTPHMESYVHLSSNFITSPIASDAGTIIPQVASPSARTSHDFLHSQPPTVRGRNDFMSSMRNPIPADRPSLPPRGAPDTPKPESRIELLNSHTPPNQQIIEPLVGRDALETQSVSNLSLPGPSATPSTNTNHSLGEPRGSIRGSAGTAGFVTALPSSTVSIASVTHPQVLPGQPFRLRIGHSLLIFEMDGRGRGALQIEELADCEEHTLGRVIDIHHLQENETIELDREADGDGLAIHLTQAHGRTVRIQLQWLPS